MEMTQLMLFMLASVLVIITPGQDLLLVMSNAVSQGSRAGVITATGVSFGLLGHSALAAFGLGALLLASESLFIILKVIGACYLLYLGVRLLIHAKSGLDLEEPTLTSPKKLFYTGAFSNISNPQITIFYFAFLPQFIPAGAERPTFMLLMLGISFAVLTLLVKGGIGFFAGTVSAWFRSSPKTIKLIERMSGLMLIGLAIKLAMGSRS